jgi:hypothetical protein
VPKRENLELAFLHSVNPSICLGDLGTEAKNGFFSIILVLISVDFGFYNAWGVFGKKV